MIERKWVLLALAAALPWVCAVGSARAADAAGVAKPAAAGDHAMSTPSTSSSAAAALAPAPGKTATAVAADDSPGPNIQIRTSEGDEGPRRVFLDDSPGPKILIRTRDGGPGPDAQIIGGGPGPIAIPAPPGGPGRNTIFLQRGLDGLPSPGGPDGPKMFIALPPGHDGMPGPNVKGIATFRSPVRMWENDPEMQRLLEVDASLDRQSQELAEEFRHGPKDKQAEVKKKLEDIVTRQFEARQERRGLELKRLEDEIKRIQTSIDKRNAIKKQIVDRRVSEVLGQDDTSF